MDFDSSSTTQKEAEVLIRQKVAEYASRPRAPKMMTLEHGAKRPGRRI
jgi:hypothetical protein